ncbi:MAG: methionine adenosyltransferase [Christensenellales bacterium]|jgi:S-adenosylmethionine synthetase
MKKRLFTSESVTEGHPDKICDQISDAILDAILEKDSSARVACEVCATTGMVLVMGEISTNCYVDIPSVARDTIRKIGYDSSDLGFDYKTCAVIVAIDEQSSDIAMGVDKSAECKESGCEDKYNEIGAGDQGMMFGFASDETEELMPMPIVLAHKLTKRLSEVRKTNLLPYLWPDGKAQVTVEYDETGKAKRVDAIVLSTQHKPEAVIERLVKDIQKHVIEYVIPKEMIDDNTKIYINPTGRFVRGGPYGDSGLTGRKIIVDTYGGYIPHGGGAFSGKDPTKVDRSAAYMARYVCKNIVAAGLARKCEINVSYAIGRAHPVSININTFDTGLISDEELAKIAKEVFDFRPMAIIDKLKLNRPQYFPTASYGHFGREGFAWEQTDMVSALLKKANIN